MTDLFPALELGDALTKNYQVVECEVVTTAVTKGMVVEFTHQAGDLPKVSPAGSASVIAKGVVVGYCPVAPGVTPGAAGTRVLVGYDGIFKVTAGTGGTTAGNCIICAASGGVCDGVTAGQVIGKAIHTMAAADTGLCWID